MSTTLPLTAQEAEAKTIKAIDTLRKEGHAMSHDAFERLMKVIGGKECLTVESWETCNEFHFESQLDSDEEMFVVFGHIHSTPRQGDPSRVIVWIELDPVFDTEEQTVAKGEPF